MSRHDAMREAASERVSTLAQRMADARRELLAQMSAIADALGDEMEPFTDDELVRLRSLGLRLAAAADARRPY